MTHSAKYRDYIHSFQWQLLRERAITNAGNRCQRCNDFSCGLHVHHKHYNTLGRECLP